MSWRFSSTTSDLQVTVLRIEKPPCSSIKHNNIEESQEIPRSDVSHFTVLRVLPRIARSSLVRGAVKSTFLFI